MSQGPDLGHLECFVHILARVLWNDIVKPRIRACGTAPSIVGVDVARQFTSLTAKSSRVEEVEDRLVLLDRRGGFVATLGPKKDGARLPADVAYQTTKKLASRAAIELWRFLLTEGWHQRYEGLELYNVITVIGGYQALAKQLGFKTGKARATLKAAVHFLSHVNDIGAPLWKGNVLNVGEWAQAPGKPARIEFTLLGPLRPGAVEEVYNEQLRNKMLVPIPRLAPPLVGGQQTYASQMNMQQLTLVELRERAEEFASEGSVQIKPARWEDIAIEAGFSGRGLSSTIDKVLGAWEGPFLVAKSDNRWDLAETYNGEKTLIVDGGKAQIGARLAGRTSARRRRLIKKRYK